jgi:gamma-glutamylcyclotransferase (GGCT)/AIG2-like uncharacterized protein YtfP
MKEFLNEALRQYLRQAIEAVTAELEVDRMLGKLHEYPALIRAQQDVVSECRRRVEEAKSAVDLARAVVAAAVLSETDGNGKPRYSNDKTREAEITRRLASDPEYQAALANLRAAQEEGDAAQFELDRLFNEFAAARAAARVLAAKMNLLAAF